MRRFFVAFCLLLLTVLCFPQQNSEFRVIGRGPAETDERLYKLQVGSFTDFQNAEMVSTRLAAIGLPSTFENSEGYNRVMVSGLRAADILICVEILKTAGFFTAFISVDTDSDVSIILPASNLAISEKWSIPGGQGSFSSFEFTQEHRYIAVESADEKVHFGEYTMPTQNIINMSDLGTLRIAARYNDELALSFSPANDPSSVESVSAVVEPPMQRDPETDLFTRAWRVINNTRDGVRHEESIGIIFLFSINETYLVTRPDYSFISRWRWVGDSREEFEYSHDNWGTYGRVRIDSLNESSMIFNDYTFGGSSIRAWIHDLVPHITD